MLYIIVIINWNIKNIKGMNWFFKLRNKRVLDQYFRSIEKFLLYIRFIGNFRFLFLQKFK